MAIVAASRALRPDIPLTRLALKLGLAASGARILPHQLPITIPSLGSANCRLAASPF